LGIIFWAATIPLVIHLPAEEAAAPASAVLLTPKPGPAPRINGPAIFGAHPGHPFLYRIPAQGERPMIFSAKGLPEGLQLDANSGIITGVTPPRGEYKVTLRAKNSHGRDRHLFKIISGDTLALTPPMGWNDWYAYYNRVTDQDIRQAADSLVSSGMADAGYQYVNIDDCWGNTQDSKKDPLRTGPYRDAQANLLPNKYFPDMKPLTDYVHTKGLKAGIYTSPGPTTCARFAGSYQHEAQDARQFADWGFDFLKYDWCSYTSITGKKPGLDKLEQPYQLMGDLLKEQNRDMVFNLCQYGMGNVWEWGADVGAQSWRTGGDLGFELNRIFPVALKNAALRNWQKPGAWNDPDYIQIGYIGNARGEGLPQLSRLAPEEQYAYMSLWCLMASPLFYSGDMTKLNDFTLNVLCNPEVIAVDQDALGECARVVNASGPTFLMIKTMADGTHALGLCNGGEVSTALSAKWTDLGLKTRQRVRDLWRQKDLGVFPAEFTSTVPAHGVMLVRLTDAR